jgi:hypothetical protein
VNEVKYLLRLWLRGKGKRSVAALVGLDRKTVQRYIAAADALGDLGIARGGESPFTARYMSGRVKNATAGVVGVRHPHAMIRE